MKLHSKPEFLLSTFWINTLKINSIPSDHHPLNASDVNPIDPRCMINFTQPPEWHEKKKMVTRGLFRLTVGRRQLKGSSSGTKTRFECLDICNHKVLWSKGRWTLINIGVFFCSRQGEIRRTWEESTEGCHWFNARSNTRGQRPWSKPGLLSACNDPQLTELVDTSETAA